MSMGNRRSSRLALWLQVHLQTLQAYHLPRLEHQDAVVSSSELLDPHTLGRCLICAAAATRAAACTRGPCKRRPRKEMRLRLAIFIILRIRHIRPARRHSGGRLSGRRSLGHWSPDQHGQRRHTRGQHMGAVHLVGAQAGHDVALGWLVLFRAAGIQHICIGIQAAQPLTEWRRVVPWSVSALRRGRAVAVGTSAARPPRCHKRQLKLAHIGMR